MRIIEIKSKMRYILGMQRLFLLCFIIPLFISCTARISGSLEADGSASLSVNMSLEPRMTTLIQRLAAAGGAGGGAILDSVAIAQSMSNAPGVASIRLRNTAPAAIEGTINISNISEFLAAADAERGGQERFINFEQGALGGSCRINLNIENSPVILELLSMDIADYLNVLMAPLVTGEEMTRPEYLDLVASVFNRAISDEIASSRVRAYIDFPGPVTRVRGGTFSGRRAVFDIPLLDLLVLETPVILEVEWRN